MKKKFFKHLAAVIVVIVIVATCIPFATVGAKDAIPYETTGLEALYLGNDNTGSGQNKSATTWADLSGKGNDITEITVNDKSHFTDEAFLLNTLKVNFPSAIKDVVNGQEFTVELVIGDFTSIGASYNTILNDTGSAEKIALFRRNSNDSIEFKAYDNVGGDRPTVENGLDLIKDSTLTITYKVGGKMTIYVDGVQVAQKDCLSEMGIPETDDLFLGHDLESRNFEAEFLAIRFYSVELTVEQVADNYNEDLAVCFGLNDPDTSTEASDDTSTEASDTSSAASDTSSAASDASSEATSSVADVPKTGDTGIIVFGLIAIVAIGSFTISIRKKNSVKQ